MQFRDEQAAVLPLISSYFPNPKLLSALDNSKVGVVICDRQFRYKALNQSVAEMHNVPIKGHLGQSFHQVLGNFAEKVAPFWESVLTSGQPFTNFEVTGKLPKRSNESRWIENLFPLKDGRGRITQVGCIVIEVTPRPAAPASAPSPLPSVQIRKSTSVNDSQLSQSDRERPRLSRREQEIVRLLAEAKTNKEISSLLGISIRTVETYRSRVMLKLQATSIVHLVYYAIRNQIITL